jgi:hypothetical protein
MICLEQPTTSKLFQSDVMVLLEQRAKEIASGLEVTCLRECVKMFPELGATFKRNSVDT